MRGAMDDALMRLRIRAGICMLWSKAFTRAMALLDMMDGFVYRDLVSRV